jgi:Uma2 family endonuclease
MAQDATMADAARHVMTVEEFFVWCENQENRYELVDGIPVPLRAMSGASDAHDAIVVNLIGTLFAQLAGTTCRPSTADKALRTAIRRVRRPDVTIECSPVTPKTYEARNPVAVFEILSPTTRKNDRAEKLPEYMRHPSLRAIVHIDPDVMDVLVYARGSDGQWDARRLLAATDAITVPGMDVTIDLTTLYAGVPLEA